ncbi:hypothetical protein ABZX30_15200 [Streptomyces sp. NPDC004542]|uniref:hypothetical protein n=1 Tax=Streptomyces sp. NPDC004542 TaxID=3154281 RepID=UPI0033BEFFD3
MTRALTAVAEVAACAALPGRAGSSEPRDRAACTVGGQAAAWPPAGEAAGRVLPEVVDLARPGQERRDRAVIRSGLAAGRLRPLFAGGRG